MSGTLVVRCPRCNLNAFLPVVGVGDWPGTATVVHRADDEHTLRIYGPIGAFGDDPPVDVSIADLASRGIHVEHRPAPPSKRSWWRVWHRPEQREKTRPK